MVRVELEIKRPCMHPKGALGLSGLMVSGHQQLRSSLLSLFWRASGITKQKRILCCNDGRRSEEQQRVPRLGGVAGHRIVARPRAPRRWSLHEVQSGHWRGCESKEVMARLCTSYAQ